MANRSCVNNVSPGVVDDTRIEQLQRVLMKYPRTGEFLHISMNASAAIGSFKANTVPDMDFLCSRAVIIAASISLSEKGRLVGIMISREEYPRAVERKYKCANLVTILDHRGRPLLPQWSGLLSTLLNCPVTRAQFDREVFVPHLINMSEAHRCGSQRMDTLNDSPDCEITCTGPIRPFPCALAIAFDGKLPKREQLHCLRVIREVEQALAINVTEIGDMTIPLLSTFLQTAFKRADVIVKPQSRLQNFVLGKYVATEQNPSELIDRHIYQISQAFSTLIAIYCQLQLTKSNYSQGKAANTKKSIGGSSQGILSGYDFGWLTHFAGRAIDLAHSILNPNTQMITDNEDILQFRSTIPLDPHIVQKVADRLGSCVVDVSYGFVGVVIIKLMKSLKSSLFINDKSIAK